MLLAVCVACGARSPDRVDKPNERSIVTAEASQDSLHRLSLREPTLRRSLDSTTATDRLRHRFVRVQVTEVTNPSRVALSFELSYLVSGVTTPLGTVSLFPADNPGRFIIPTLGRLRDSGELVLTLVSPDAGAGRDAVRVTVRQLAFVDQ
jgi:hypothetical protein